MEHLKRHANVMVDLAVWIAFAYLAKRYFVIGFERYLLVGILIKALYTEYDLKCYLSK